MAEIIVNGQKHPLTDNMTITNLLSSLSLPSNAVVVELNGTIVPAINHEETPLNAGDMVEIVHFVGGG